MLIRFSVENFMSFNERTELSLIPSKVRRHPEHVIKAKSKNGISVLKTAIIYGANASGKSNLIKAMKHAQTLINSGFKAGKKLPYNPFKLNSVSEVAPSRFEFEVKIGESNYAYGFIVDDTNIHEEWLFEVNKINETCIFERKGEKFLFGDIKFNSEEEEQYLNFTAIGTPENRLFLNECKERNVYKQLPYLNAIQETKQWFENKLNIVFPNTKHIGLEIEMQKSEQTSKIFSRILESFDTGIKNLTLKEINPENDFLSGFPDELKSRLLDDLDDGATVLIAGPRNERFQISKDKNGDVKVSKLMTSHLNEKGKERLFDLNEESDGTQRLLDIALGLIDVFSEEKVYIIDELDRSLHPDITTSILNSFLKNTADIHSQLIVTTHESNLLNQDLVRKDEVWFAQKNIKGDSTLYSLEEYQPRFDNDIRRGYLSGRFGGVPILPSFENLSWMKKDG